MPFVGLGLHVVVALFFAIHAVRSGQQMYWIFILFSFPLLGSIAYFLVIYLPNSRLEYGARKVVAAAAKSLDPMRELREARAAFEYTPTAQNQMRLALALLESGAADEAATNYEACLKGPFASDMEIKFCAARAFVESGRHVRAVEGAAMKLEIGVIELKKLLLLSLLIFAMPGFAVAQLAEPEWLSSRNARVGKVLVTFNSVPSTVDYQVLGPISAYSRWFGGFGSARYLLAEKARALGANAVIQSAFWLAPAFPVPVAPHGSGIAVHIPDIWELERLADKASSWE